MKSTATNPIQSFATKLLAQRKRMIKAEKGNYTIRVIAAFERIEKDFISINCGRHKDNEFVWGRFFRNNEEDLRTIMFGRTAKQYEKMNELFDEAFKHTLTLKEK